MHKLRRFYYQNKKKIWKIITFIIFIILIIQLLNFIIKTKNKNFEKQENINIATNNTINNNKNNTQIIANESAVTGNKLPETQLENAQKIIEEFINYCNNNEIEKAYSLLSDDCKKQFYPTINNFYDLYIKEKFSSNIKKVAKIENWIANTYKVDIYEDAMESGNINTDKIQDYITIIKDNNAEKININSFIKSEKINKEETIDNIQFNIIEKNTFLDYEEYKIKVTNNNETTILLDNLESTKTIYVTDTNNIKYYSITNEIVKNLLEIKGGFSTEITIKFYKKYSPTRKTQELIFSNVLFNYKINTQEKKEIKIVF